MARRMKLFSTKQRDLVHKLAERYKVGVPPDVERFFDALDAGNYDEAQRLFRLLRDRDMNGAPGDPALKKYWRAIQEAWGAAQQVQLWPAQQLLDYGNGILDSLKPGMVYVGGTDCGCFICTMLNATTDGEQHVTLTQNALADGSYMDYLRATIGDSVSLPTADETATAFTQYMEEAKRRLLHDQQFPDEPKQVLEGEDIALDGERVTVSGQKAVMAINEMILQDLVKRNPDQSFALEESFPLKSTYDATTPLGPIFELNGAKGGNGFTADMADQAVNYWQDVSQNLPAGATAETWAQGYAHDATAEGNLLAANQYPDQAEQAYQLALAMSPNSVEAIVQLVKLWAGEGRNDEAGQALDAFLRVNPTAADQLASMRQLYMRGK